MPPRRQFSTLRRPRNIESPTSGKCYVLCRLSTPSPPQTPASSEAQRVAKVEPFLDKLTQTITHRIMGELASGQRYGPSGPQKPTPNQQDHLRPNFPQKCLFRLHDTSCSSSCHYNYSYLRGDVKIHWLQPPYSAASCSQPI